MEKGTSGARGARRAWAARDTLPSGPNLLYVLSSAARADAMRLSSHSPRPDVGGGKGCRCIIS